MSNHPPPSIDMAELARLARVKRASERIQGRAAAAAIGISHASYSRFESGVGGLSVHSFYLLTEWLGIADRPVRTFALPRTATRVMS